MRRCSACGMEELPCSKMLSPHFPNHRMGALLLLVTVHSEPTNKAACCIYLKWEMACSQARASPPISLPEI